MSCFEAPVWKRWSRNFIRGKTGAPVKSALEPPTHGSSPGRRWKRSETLPPAMVIRAMTTPSTFTSSRRRAASTPEDGADCHRSDDEQRAPRLRAGAELPPAGELRALSGLRVQNDDLSRLERVFAVEEGSGGAAALDSRRSHRA